MTQIKIHQFSTGINIGGTPDNWYSLGYLGGYMNSTLESIPKSVQMNIEAGLFKIAEGKSSHTPALIGREVEYEGDAWSVLAVVTRGVDDGGRKNSYYRYFLTQGLGRLEALIAWYIKVAGKPVYNPFDVKQVRYPDIYDVLQTDRHQNFDGFNKLISHQIIPWNQPCSEVIIHYLAQKKQKNDRRIAWAYKVEGLEKPEYFHVIYPASAEAQNVINQKININVQSSSPPSTIKQMEGNETDVFTAVSNIINDANITGKHIDDIIKALKNQNFTQKHWEQEIFSKFRVDRESSSETYSAIAVRWHFLRGLILPHTLPKFVEWLSHNKLDRKPWSSSYQAVIKISNDLDNHRDSRDTLQNNVKKGIDNLLVAPLVKKNQLIITRWFLQESSIYAKEFEKSNYIEQIHNDLEQINKNKSVAIKNRQNETFNLEETAIELNLEVYLQEYPINIESEYLRETSILNREAWLPITKEICKIIWFKKLELTSSNPTSNGKLPELKGLADLFSKIDKSKNNGGRVAALLYQLSQGDVPTEVWERCRFGQDDILPNSGDKNPKDRAFLYGLKIDRHIGKVEQAQRLAANGSTWGFRELAKPTPKIPRYLSLITLISAFLLGSMFRSFPSLHLFDFTKLNLLQKNPQQDFIKTVNALTSIEKELSDKLPPSSLPKPTAKPKQIIQAEIVKIIDSEGNNNLDFANKIRSSQQWEKSIKQYQEKLRQEYSYKNIEVTGNFETGDNTDRVLRCAIEKKLNIALDEVCMEKFDEYISKIVISSDWIITKKSLEQLRDEFIKNHKLDLSKVQQAISKILIIPQEEAFLKNDSLWMKQINEFQVKYNIYDIRKGVIYPPDPKLNPVNEINSSERPNVNNKKSDTYDVLKCSIAKELNTICKSITEFDGI
jgi:hypothetical protein